MATLTGFTRTTDPTNADDLASAISLAQGSTVAVVLTPTDIQVTGNISESDRAVIQAAITGYTYTRHPGDALYISDSFPMQSRSSYIVTENVAKQGDIAARRKAYVSGVLKNDSFIYSSKATTNNSGVVTLYITSDGTANGSAVYTNVYPDSISVAVYGSTANYQPYSPTVSGDNKSVTVTINQATSVLLGVIQLVTAANGVDCRLYVMGD